MIIAKGYTAEGDKFELTLEGNHLYINDELFNDEYYDEDDTTALMSVRDGLVSEGYKLI